jgi:hypothetical protein
MANGGLVELSKEVKKAKEKWLIIQT